MYYVYILKSKKIKNWLYIGSTNNLKRRFEEHQNGKSFSTKNYKPFILIYYEAFFSEIDARERERQLKSYGNSYKFLKKRIINSLEN